jgi:hypothetical protein
MELLRSTGIAVLRLNDFDHICGIIGNMRAVGYSVGEDSMCRQSNQPHRKPLVFI